MAIRPYAWYAHEMAKVTFEWDAAKNSENFAKHGVTFEQAQYAFTDPRRVIAQDLGHSTVEDRYFCFGEIEGAVLTVRFTYRANSIRIFGAGYWRKGKLIYEKQTDLHK